MTKVKPILSLPAIKRYKSVLGFGDSPAGPSARYGILPRPGQEKGAGYGLVVACVCSSLSCSATAGRRSRGNPVSRLPYVELFLLLLTSHNKQVPGKEKEKGLR